MKIFSKKISGGNTYRSLKENFFMHTTGGRVEKRK